MRTASLFLVGRDSLIVRNWIAGGVGGEESVKEKGPGGDFRAIVNSWSF